MKKMLVILTLALSFSVFADPILNCDQSALGTALEISPVTSIKDVSEKGDFIVYDVSLSHNQLATITFDRDCDFWDLEMSETHDL